MAGNFWMVVVVVAGGIVGAELFKWIVGSAFAAIHVEGLTSAIPLAARLIVTPVLAFRLTGSVQDALHNLGIASHLLRALQ
jgi:hypothetical protein